MSTVLSCQDLRFVGGQRYNCPYSASTSAEPSVDVSTETLVSLWDASPRDNALCQQHEPPLRELQYSDHGDLSHQTWPELLSPHLQRNKQLQDTLLQREEELAKLHEENHKLREFLSSSYVRGLEERRKKLLYAPSRHRKRRQQAGLGGQGPDLEGRGPGGMVLGGVSKRTCRNLSLEFCSAEELAATPPLDSWVLETLGLKDQDTIDPESSFGSRVPVPVPNPPPPGYSPASDPPSATYSPPLASATYTPPPPPPTAPPWPPPASGSYDRAADSFASHASALSSQGSEFSPSAEMPPMYAPTATPPALHPHRLLSPSPCEHLAPVAASTPQRSSRLRCRSGSPGPAGGSGEQCSPAHGRGELAFSMLLSPHSSVRTHSFPQGQAFVRKDTQGGWKFTWVPKQCA
ncbi:hypothetical protein ACEWY4_008460 [Coilia grayii]|uniref:Geminin coiled-coil domain containing n=1 Tax=Coilia grayii TaxID=363190 RepID=A0ABD1KAZ4_9TELE